MSDSRHASDDLRDQVFDLVDAYMSGDLTNADIDRLRSLVCENADARRYYLEFMHDTANVDAWVRETEQQQSEVSDHRSAVSHAVHDNDVEATTLRPRSLLQRASRHPKGPSIAIAIAVMLMVLGAMAITPVRNWIASGGKDTEERPVRAETSNEFVAILNNSHNAKWLDDTQPRLKDPRLRIGRRLAIASGLIEVKYYSGVLVVIEGPAEFVIGGTEAVGTKAQSEVASLDSANSGYLKLGKLVARVEGEKAQGFAIDTPFARIEDLGTEFGVEVSRSGAAEVVVLSGEVDVVRESSPGIVAERVRLTKDQGAFVAANDGAIARATDIDVRHFATLRAQIVSFATAAHSIGAGVIISPATAASTTQNDRGRTIARVVDGSGLSFGGSSGDILRERHDAANSGNNHWLSATDAINDYENFRSTTETLTFGLPRPSNVNAIHLWPYARPERARGLKSFDISFSTDNGATYPVTIKGTTLGEFAMGPTGGPVLPESKAFAVQSGVTHIKLTNLTTHGSKDRIAIAEIRFGGPSVASEETESE